MKGFVCGGCGFISINGSAPEKCPVCGAPQSAFDEKEDAINTAADPNNPTDFEKKHTPEVTVVKECGLVANCVDVHAKVGGIPHPMDAEHFIHHLDFYLDNEYISRVILTPAKLNPAAGLHLKVSSGKVSVIEFCTLHGTWIGEANL